MATEKKRLSARLQLWQDFITEEADLVEEPDPPRKISPWSEVTAARARVG